MSRLLAVCLALGLTACGAADANTPENPVRAALEQSVAGLDAQQPLILRYNPAACACPPAEVRLDGQWLRAELTGDGPLQTWLAGLARTPQENLPVALQVLGQIERDVLRTPQGSYAVRIEVSKILSPPASATPPK